MFNFHIEYFSYLAIDISPIPIVIKVHFISHSKFLLFPKSSHHKWINRVLIQQYLCLLSVYVDVDLNLIRLYVIAWILGKL